MTKMLYILSNILKIIIPISFAKQLIKGNYRCQIKTKRLFNFKQQYLFFYQDENDSILLEYLDKNNELSGAITIDEICNKQKLITYPIHSSVYNLFYNYSSLIYLLDKNNDKYEIPLLDIMVHPSSSYLIFAPSVQKANSTKYLDHLYYLGSFFTCH